MCFAVLCCALLCFAVLCCALLYFADSRGLQDPFGEYISCFLIIMKGTFFICHGFRRTCQPGRMGSFQMCFQAAVRRTCRGQKNWFSPGVPVNENVSWCAA